MHPTLTAFCSQLTGITQTQIDSAHTFTDVLDSFRRWLQQKRIVERYAFVTDG